MDDAKLNDTVLVGFGGRKRDVLMVITTVKTSGTPGACKWPFGPTQMEIGESL